MGLSPQSVYSFKNQYNCFSVLDRETEIDRLSLSKLKQVSFELIHEQLPLPVPCYDLVPVTELTLGPRKVRRRALPAPLT